MKNNIKKQINNLHSFFKSMGNTVTVWSVDDIANIVAKTHGYNNIASLLLDVQNKTNNNAIRKQETKSQFRDKEVSKTELNTTYPRQKQKHNASAQWKERTPVLSSYLIGYIERKNEKVKSPINLLLKNTLIYEANQTKLKQNLCDWLIHSNQPCHLLGVSEQIEQNLNAHNQANQDLRFIKMIGPSYVRLDPITEMLNEQALDILVGSPHSSFESLWVTLISLSHSELNILWYSDSLSHSVTLEGVLSIYHLFKENGHVLSSLIRDYLFRECGIEDTGEAYHISQESYRYHELQSQALAKTVNDMCTLYRHGFFKDQSGVSIKKLIYDGDSTAYQNVDKEYQVSYFNLIISLYDRVLKKAPKKEVKQESVAWMVFLEADFQLNQNNADVLDSPIMTHTCFSESGLNLDKYQNRFFQLLLLDKIPNTYSEWIVDLISRTKQLRPNPFYEEPKAGHAFLWRTELDSEDKGWIQEYTIKDIVLYANQS